MSFRVIVGIVVQLDKMLQENSSFNLNDSFKAYLKAYSKAY